MTSHLRSNALYFGARTVNNIIEYRQAHWNAQICLWGHAIEGRSRVPKVPKPGSKCDRYHPRSCCTRDHRPNAPNGWSSTSACRVRVCCTPAVPEIGSVTARAAVHGMDRPRFVGISAGSCSLADARCQQQIWACRRTCRCSMMSSILASNINTFEGGDRSISCASMSCFF